MQMPSSPEGSKSQECAIEHGGFSYHGGRLCAARRLFPDAPAPWVDLSTGISPWPYPAPRATNQARNRLPEPTALARLESTAASAFGVDDARRVVAVGGTESALRLLPHMLGLEHAVIVGPTYGSHADAWQRAGATTSIVSFASADVRAAAAVTVVNPNNPDGRTTDRRSLLALHASLAKRGGVLIVDEAFAEVEPQISVADIAGTDVAPRLIVLRSFGKFYGLAGARLGFVIAAPCLADGMRHLIGDWPVSADALVAGLAAYADAAWAQRRRERLRRMSQRLDALLTRAGFQITGGTHLFRLVRAAYARERFTQLMSAGVLARPFEHDTSLLRFGLPRDSRELGRVAAALGVVP